MFNRFMLSALLVTAGILMSFSTTNNASQLIASSIKGKNGDTLTVTNPSAGTAVMTWSFAAPSSATSIFIIEDVVHREVVKSGSTTLNSATATGLKPGTYRFTVSNGSSFVVVEDLLMY